MTTQGNERFNYNNHPFWGKIGDTPFALAHNGILTNDDELVAFINEYPKEVPYIMEEFVHAEVNSYDAIIDAEGNRAWCQPVFVEELLHLLLVELTCLPD